MFHRDELADKKKPDLIAICKEHGISTRHRNEEMLSRKELVERILDYDPRKLAKMERDYHDRLKRYDLVRHIENAKEGTIFAFQDCKGKMRTGAFVKFLKVEPIGKKVVILETKWGGNFCVSYGDVFWVRENGSGRWPDYVYYRLKGWGRYGKKSYK